MKQLMPRTIVVVFTVILSASPTIRPCAAQPPQPRVPSNVPAPSNVKDGLSINKETAFQGYSLIAPMNSKSTYLIDMEGRIVNEWKSEFTPALSAYLLPNGHLLRPASERGFGVGGPGAGGRIQEFNWEGELVWDFSLWTERYHPHHDICPLPNGNVLVIAHDIKTADEAVAAGRRPESVREQLLPDCILEIKPTGKTTGDIVWEWHAWDHLIQDVDKSKPGYGDIAEHPELIDINFSTNMIGAMLADPQQLAQLRSLGYVGGAPRPGQPQQRGVPEQTDTPQNDSEKNNTPKEKPANSDAVVTPGPPGPGRPGGPGAPFAMEGDWMHANSVAYNAELDQIMLSIHEFSEVWIIDHGTTTAEAASHKGGRRGKGGDLLYRWGNPKVYRNGSDPDQKLFGQHCAHWISPGLPGAGNMLVFNNGSGRPDGAYSTVEEIVLPLTEDGLYEREEFTAFGPEEATWTYLAPDKTSFFSMLISGAERLANGNTIICSGNQGIVFEVSADNETVWQYKHPGAGFGPGFGSPRTGELFPEFLQQILQMSDEQKQTLAKLQAEVDAKLAELLTDEQKKQLAQPRNFFGPPGGPGPRGPARFTPPRPGEIIPAIFLDALQLTETQAADLAEFQKHVDGEVATLLTDQQKTQLDEMQKAFVRGPGFGPPGGRPPGGGPQRRGGPPGGGPPGGPPGFGPPGGPGGGPGGLFRVYRYALDYPGLAGRDLTPGQKLEDVANEARRPTNDAGQQP